MVEKNYESFQDMWEEVQRHMGDDMQPRILVAGKTGVGKSSVLNALMGENVYEVGVTPTTKENEEKMWDSKDGDIVVIDVPGFGEAYAQKMSGFDDTSTYEDNIKRLASLKAHLLLLVIKADDRALEIEQNFLESWFQEPLSKELPAITVVNQIDKITPIREWNPNNLNLKTPKSVKEKNIRKYIDYVEGLDCFKNLATQNRVIPVSAGESSDDPYQYGINDLRNKIYEMLPECARFIFAREAELRDVEARRLIKKFSASCAGAVTANFFPASDALILAPIQIAMIMKLGKLHKLDVTLSTASGIFTSMGLSFAGRFAAQKLISLVPGVKNLVGPSLAFALTYVMGHTINELFSQGKTDITAKDIKKAKKKYVQSAKEVAASYVKD